MCDRIRSRLETPADKPLLKAKKEFLALLDAFHSTEDDAEDATIAEEVDEENKSNEHSGRSRGKSASHRSGQDGAKNSKKIKGFWCCAEKKSKYETLHEAASHQDYDEFKRMVLKEQKRPLARFYHEFNKLTLHNRKEMRRYMSHKIKIYRQEYEEEMEARGDFDVDKLKVNEFNVQFLKNMAHPKTSEVLITKGRFIYTIDFLAFVFFLLQLVIAFPETTNQPVLQGVDNILVAVFFIETLLYFNALGRACFRRYLFLMSSFLILTSVASRVAFVALGYSFSSSPVENGDPDWTYRSLRAMFAIPVFRIFFVIYEYLQKKLLPTARFVLDEHNVKKIQKKREKKEKNKKGAKNPDQKDDEEKSDRGDSTDSLSPSPGRVRGESVLKTAMSGFFNKSDLKPLQEISESRKNIRLDKERDKLQVKLKKMEKLEEQQMNRQKEDDELIAMDTDYHFASFETILMLKNLFVNLGKVLSLISVIIFCFIYFWGVLGMELFSCDGIENDPLNNFYTHFNALPNAILLLLQLMTGNNWHQVNVHFKIQQCSEPFFNSGDVPCS
jgi:hypothetical protein